MIGVASWLVNPAVEVEVDMPALLDLALNQRVSVEDVNEVRIRSIQFVVRIGCDEERHRRIQAGDPR